MLPEAMSAAHPALAQLRRQLTGGLARRPPVAPERVGFGWPELDAVLEGGLGRAALHELYASGLASLPTTTVVALGLACRAAEGRPILWVRQDALDAEAGRPHPPGLAELGLDPARVLLVRARDAKAVLRAGSEGARCAALGAVVIEPWGEPRQMDLTASRRLALSAEASGVITLLLRAARPQPSAARSRWLVEASASRAREANAPGDPAFRLRLLRHRGRCGEGEWCVEWNRDRRCFQPGTWPPASDRPHRSADVAPLPGAVVAFPGDRQAAADPAIGTQRRAAG